MVGRRGVFAAFVRSPPAEATISCNSTGTDGPTVEHCGICTVGGEWMPWLLSPPLEAESWESATNPALSPAPQCAANAPPSVPPPRSPRAIPTSFAISVSPTSSIVEKKSSTRGPSPTTAIPTPYVTVCDPLLLHNRPLGLGPRGESERGWRARFAPSADHGRPRGLTMREGRQKFGRPLIERPCRSRAALRSWQSSARHRCGRRREGSRPTRCWVRSAGRAYCPRCQASSPL